MNFTTDTDKFTEIRCRSVAFISQCEKRLGWKIDEHIKLSAIRASVGEIVGRVATLDVIECGSAWPAQLVQLRNASTGRSALVVFSSEIDQWVPIPKTVEDYFREVGVPFP